MITRSYILEKAKVCVTGHRINEYGSPEENFEKIAQLWEAYIKGKCVGLDADISIEPLDVAMMMALLKIARISNGGTTDSFVDLAGYAACGGEIACNEVSR